MSKLTFVIDLDRCIGCKGCQVACKMENDIALGVGRNTVMTVGPVGSYPDLQMYFLPVMCQHCEQPMCAAACPVGACVQNDKDGVVYVDKEKCIGCMRCVKACPYHVNYFDRARRIADKCTLCVECRNEDGVPACVRNCAGSALMVGDISDPESDVSKKLKAAGSENIYHLRDMGNKPSVCYILRNAKWIDVLPEKCKETQKG